MVHLRDGAWCTAGLFSHVQWKTQPWSSAVALSVPDLELNTTATATVSWTSLSWTFLLPKVTWEKGEPCSLFGRLGPE